MRSLLALAVVLGIPAFGPAQANGPLSVPLIAKGGEPAGTITITDTPNGVLVSTKLKEGAVEAGEHGMHFHEVGDCSDTEKFEKAGGHYNPAGAEHGFLPEAGPHAGDMPNIVVAEGQETEFSAFNPAVRLTEGDAPLLDDNGSALVIHAGPDDYASQPSGKSGDRVACAELKGS
jgi:Cu-Zn family superoxide dismutase